MRPDTAVNAAGLARVRTALLCIAVAAATSFVLPMTLIVTLVPDDAFFYIKTANNFALGLGSTFDGINPTNGYHPLWFLILAILMRGAHAVGLTSPDHLLRVTIWASLMMCAGTASYVAAIFRVVNPQARLVTGGIAAGLIAAVLLVKGQVGTESLLVCLLASMYIWTTTAEMATGPRAAWMKAFALSLLVLARVDFLFTVVPVILLFEVWSRPPSERLKTVLVLGIPAIAVSLMYFSVNYQLFGHPMPISAVVKSSFPTPVLAGNLRELYDLVKATDFRNVLEDGTLAAFRPLVPVAAYPLFCWWAFRRSASAPHHLDLTLIAFATGAMVFLALHASFNDTTVTSTWYLAFPTFIAVLMLLRMGLMTPSVSPTINVVLVVLASAYALRVYHAPAPSRYDYARELPRVTEAHETIFQIDESGLVGFFSERRVINGDGLINSFEFNRYIKARRLTDYLRDKSVDYYSSNSMTNINATQPHLPAFYVDQRYAADEPEFPFTCRADQVVAGLHDEWVLCRLKPDLLYGE